MSKMKITTAYVVISIFILVFSIARAENIDSEAISQVSMGIAEWKLMNEGKDESPAEHMVYVSSSLSGMVTKGRGEKITVVQGLEALDDSYGMKSQIKLWELHSRVDASNHYLSRLPTNPPLTDRIYSMSSRTAIYGIEMYVDRTYGHIGSQIYTSGTMVIGTVGQVFQAVGTFFKTVDYVGKFMQVMNPPIYLQNNPKFIPSQRILGIPFPGRDKLSQKWSLESEPLWRWSC